MKLCIDKGIYSAKPQKRDISIISNRIGQQIEDTDINSFARQVIQPFGRSWTPAYFKPDTNEIIERTNACWAGQTIFALDFDKGITLNEVLERCKKYAVIPAFAYSTFSSVDNNKFRVVFQNPIEIQDIRVRNVLQSALMGLFPECDKTCNDCARMFLGGKELIHENYTDFIDIEQVVDSMCLFLMENDKGRHATRSIRNYCQLTGLDMLNELPKIRVISSVDVAQTPPLSNINIYNYQRSNCANKSNYEMVILYFTDKMSIDAVKNASRNTRYDINEEKNKRVFRSDFDFTKLEEKCKLYCDFVSGDDWLYHNELFGLATNLLNIDGGEKRFTQVIKSNEQYSGVVDSWKKAHIPYIIKKAYTPQNCSGFCKYSGECEHGKNVIETGKLPLGRINVYQEIQFKPIEQAEAELKQQFERIMQEDGNKVYVIKAPTGLGKTENFLGVKDTTIAVPRHNLKEDIANRMIRAGNVPDVVPARPKNEVIEKSIDYYYQRGQNVIANALIKKEAKNNPEVAKYLEQRQKYAYGTGTCITTHERLLIASEFSPISLSNLTNLTPFQEKVIELYNASVVKNEKRETKNNSIIIDEDILTNLLHVDCMLLQDYCKVCSEIDKPNSLIKSYYNTFQDRICGEVPKGLDFLFEWLCEADDALLKHNEIQSNVLGFLKADYWRSDDINVQYIRKRKLPDKKTITLSATASETFYRQFLGDRLEFIDLGHVKPKGRIIQYPQMSFSRRCLRENKNALKFAKAIAGDKPVITFKNYQNEFRNCIATFGNLTGLDNFSNQDIVIVGTPHINSNAYWLLAVALRMIPAEAVDENMMRIPVKRNGMEFYFNTFVNNEILRNVQLEMIEAELVQAVGRARLLRNNCTVTVLSNFPLPGAEFKYLKNDEILKIINKGDD